MPIRLLPPEVADKIAAGEVVERPASVVKELVENAVDAGATTIRVEIREGGIRLVRVVDDGVGIPAAEVPLAVQRHATSKIASAQDLMAIRTLGFRGEALASIASVSHLTLVTRARDEEVGTRLRVEGGRVTLQERTGAPPGTMVTVEHLFFNIPARRKFLKRPATESGHVHRVVTRYALAYPQLRITLVNDGRLVFQSTGSGQLLDVLVSVLGQEVARQMVAVGVVDPPWPEPGPEPVVWGYVGEPRLHRANRQHITLFLNRRWIQDSQLAHAVVQAYHTLLPAGRYPVAIVHIALDPHLVDVNVHPTKAEVRLRDPRAVFSAVQKGVRKAVVAVAPAREVTPGVAWTQPPGWAERRRSLVELGQPARASLDLRVERAPAPLPAPSEAETSPAFAVASRPDAARPLPLLRVVGQVGGAYIVAEGPDGLYLIDQHAAHERVLYERLMAERLDRGEVARQQLLEPVPVDVGSDLAGLLAEHLEVLTAVGFEVEPFGGDTYLVRAVPAVLSGQEPGVAVEEVLRGLGEDRDLTADAVEARLVALICKRAALKAGQVLSQEEMQELVEQLEACQTPHTCPHGRPTMIYITAADLAKRFGRG